MLSFVGLGLYDEHSITLEGQETLRSADKIFAEQYTSALTGTSLAAVESFHDITITAVDRSEVETDPTRILSAAQEAPTVFLVGGDPMISTTHIDLRLRAEQAGIETRVVHGTTAQTAASSLTGLQNYRFGKSTTLPFPGTHGEAVPASVIDTIESNLERDLHTIVYLDIDDERTEYLTAEHAARLLTDPLDDRLAVVIARAGSRDSLVKADRLSELATKEFGDPLHLLCIPASLHDLEVEALQTFGDAPTAVLEGSHDELG